MFAHAGALNCHDWIQLVQTAGDYVLGGLFANAPRKEEALHGLLAVCNSILQTSSDFQSDNRDLIDDLKVKVVEALVKCESILPATEMPVMLHILLHVPDCIYRWNSVRNYWSFFGERMMGYIIRFIHNRDLAAENIMTAYCRLRLVLDSPPRAVANLMDKLKLQAHMFTYNSMLSISNEISRIQQGQPGVYSYHINATRRNTRSLVFKNVPTERKSITACVKTLLSSLNYSSTYAPANTHCEVLISGVRINGRLFRQGDHCEYLPKVPRRPNQPGVGGSLGSSVSHLIGTIGMFYRFKMIGGDTPATFVSIKPRTLVERDRSMYIVSTVSDDTSVSGFKYVHLEAHTLVHIDSITAKVKLVPHYDEAKCTDFMCAIRMWCVR